MTPSYAWEDRAHAERESLDAEGLAAYRRCRAGGMSHGEAMQVGRDDMGIRASAAARRARETLRSQGRAA